MKLSEAMRLGATLGPHIRGRLFGDGGGTCAMGGALKAMGFLSHDFCFYIRYNKFLPTTIWPWIIEKRTCPHCGEPLETRAIITVHLNDTHEWSREKIADWVEEVEPVSESIVESSQVPVAVA